MYSNPYCLIRSTMTSDCQPRRLVSVALVGTGSTLFNGPTLPGRHERARTAAGGPAIDAVRPTPRVRKRLLHPSGYFKAAISKRLFHHGGDFGDHILRGLVDLRDELLDLLAGHGRDLEVAFPRLGQEFGILHGVHEGPAQGREAIVRDAGRRHEGTAHHLAGADEPQDL